MPGVRKVHLRCRAALRAAVSGPLQPARPGCTEPCKTPARSTTAGRTSLAATGRGRREPPPRLTRLPAHRLLRTDARASSTASGPAVASASPPCPGNIGHREGKARVQIEALTDENHMLAPRPELAARSRAHSMA